MITPLPTMPTPISRAEWDARSPNHDALEEFGFASEDNPTGWLVYDGDLREVYHTVVIHHSADLRPHTMRDMQDVHMDRQQWADIGYHFGIDSQGIIYAGRDIQARGASVAGHNTGAIGVVMMGHFEWETPAEMQLAALQTLVNWLATTYALNYLAGHGELNAGTVCPGRNLRPYLDALALGAGLQRH